MPTRSTTGAPAVHVPTSPRPPHARPSLHGLLAAVIAASVVLAGCSGDHATAPGDDPCDATASCGAPVTISADAIDAVEDALRRVTPTLESSRLRVALEQPLAALHAALTRGDVKAGRTQLTAVYAALGQTAEPADAADVSAVRLALVPAAYALDMLDVALPGLNRMPQSGR